MLFFRPWSLIFTCLTTSLSRHRGVSVFNSAGAASLQAADLEPQETQGEGRSKKAGNRVVFTRMCKDGGRTGSIQLGQVSFWRRGGGMEKEGLQRQWRRITHWMGNTQRRNGKGRQGKARESKARQGKARQGKGRQREARRAAFRSSIRNTTGVMGGGLSPVAFSQGRKRDLPCGQKAQGRRK
ncbi:hypothetical protein QYF61_022463 [Mycteria americana]|uniref:Secreted protein n=1 Tax=Mycteria americana TaxID=33587 RepID=A0AAN7N0E7_MYCAM|nr:hypothetical protein QYF61_022463 [Mycteria americana]